jgi:hypothetical protein
LRETNSCFAEVEVFARIPGLDFEIRDFSSPRETNCVEVRSEILKRVFLVCAGSEEPLEIRILR